MQLPILIGLRRSFLLDGFVVAVAAAALTATFYFPVPANWRWALLAMTGLLAAHALWRLSPRLASIRLEKGGAISIRRQGSDEFVAARPLPGATVHPWLTVLRLKSESGGKFTLVLTGGSIFPQDFRRLRVFLRWQADFSVPDDAA